MEKKPSSYTLLEAGQKTKHEHIEAFNSLQKPLNERERLELSEHELIMITRALEISLTYRAVLTIELYDPIEHLQVKGLVDQVDHQLGLFWVNGDSFILGDIEGVELHGADIETKV